MLFQLLLVHASLDFSDGNKTFAGAVGRLGTVVDTEHGGSLYFSAFQFVLNGITVNVLVARGNQAGLVASWCTLTAKAQNFCHVERSGPLSWNA